MSQGVYIYLGYWDLCTMVLHDVSVHVVVIINEEKLRG